MGSDCELNGGVVCDSTAGVHIFLGLVKVKVGS